MKSCVIYFSRTGNTKRTAEAIANAINAPTFDINVVEPAVVNDYKLLIVGTPVEGFKPAKETVLFVERLPPAQDKKVILFCTYKLYKGSVFKNLEKTLSAKGYHVVHNASKKGMKPSEPADFTEIIEEIKKAIPT